MGIETVYETKEKCCGCAACANACPKKCIEMRSDTEGFLYPVINKAHCVDCGKCQKACPVGSDNGRRTKPECFVGFSKDSNVRKKSSSGGIFTELAKQAIDESGIVYGARFDTKFNVMHSSITAKEDIELLRGSKYVQSSIGEVYGEIKEQLQKGIIVYFSGTPCQIAGLYCYLGTRPDNLITQDLICHGVGSPMVWEKYRDMYRKIKNVEFRNKKYGWHYFSMHIETDKKNTFKRLDEDFYLRLFLDNLILRPICYDCPIKKSGSRADITLADCWIPYKVTNVVVDHDKGLSLVIANTEKGKQWVECLKESESATLYVVDTQKALSSQSARTDSVKCPEQRKQFFEEITQKNFRAVAKQWYGSSLMSTFKTKYIFLKTKIKYSLIKIRRAE